VISNQTTGDGYLGLPVGPDDLTQGRFVAQVAERYGERQALVFGEWRLSYAELQREARAAAKALLAAGVTKGSKVALLLGNRPEFVVAAYGAAMAGAVVVPVSTLSAAAERDYILAHSDTSIVITQPVLLGRRLLDELMADHPDLAQAEPGHIASSRFPHLRRLVCLGPPTGFRSVQTWDDLHASQERVSEAMLDAAAASVTPSDDAVIIYTSGTTAYPKAVLHRHRAAVVQSWRWAEQLRLDPDDRIWSPYPFFWTAGLAMVLGGTLASGACLVCQEAFEPGGALELIERERVTITYSFPHIEARLVDHPDATTRDLSSVRRVMAGSPLRKLIPIDKDAADPGAAYGLTETFTLATSIRSDSPRRLRRSTHGVALPGMAVRIIDSASGAPLATGATGEIAVKGITLMRGYYKVDPEQCFDDEGWFRTGDAGYLDESGFLHWTGRLSNLIKTSGANVSPLEVETALTAWGRLKVANVVGIPHPVVGEAVVLCAVQGADPVSASEITAHLRGVLAPYKVPKHVVFLDPDEVTLTGSHKVRVDRLRSLAARRLAADDAVWARFLREQHGDLLESSSGETLHGKASE
jgi:fatty-acyl-CoA synthase